MKASSSHNPFYRAIKRSLFARYTVYAVNLMSMLLMARVYSPTTFGTVASVAAFVAFFQMMSEAGLGPAIINLDKLDPEDRDGLFGLTLVIGVVLAGGFLASRHLFERFYNIPGVGSVVPYVSVALLFFSASVVPNALLLRGQEFKYLAVSGLIAEVASTGLSIALLKLVDPIHALSSKAAISGVVNFAFVYWFSSRSEFGRPNPGRRFSAVIPLATFSSYQFGFNCVNYFSRNIDNVLVGRTLGAGPLGAYDKAYQLMRYPLVLLSFAMTPAIQPIIRKYADDPKGAEAIHADFAFKLSVIGALAGLGIYALADRIVFVLLGAAWAQVIPVIKVLAIAVPVQVVLSTIGSFYQAMNRAGLLFASGIVTGVVTVSAIAFGVMTGDLVKLSWALVIAFHINFVVSYMILYRWVFKSAPMRFFVRMLPASLVICLMVARFH